MMKRPGILLLMLCLLVLPAAAMALDVQVGDVTLPDGKYMASGGNTVVDTQPSGGYAYLKDGVLTLKDYSISGEHDAAIAVANGSLKIMLEGKNSLTTDFWGIWDGISLHDQAEIEIDGSGSLSITAPYGIYGYNSRAGDFYRKVKISGGQVSITSRDEPININEVSISGGELSIKEANWGAKVKRLIVSGGSLTSEGPGARIFADDIVISGGNVKVAVDNGMAMSATTLSISGADTVVDLTTGQKDFPVLYTVKEPEIASPLEILIPQEGSVENRGYYTVVDTDGNIASRVYIAAPSSGAASLPQTGDDSAMILWAMLASLTGAGALLLRRREEN